MPPKVGSSGETTSTSLPTSFWSSSMSKQSMPANFLKRTAFPSITGLEASGPISPRPRTAVPLVTTANEILPGRQLGRLPGIGDDRLAGGGDAGRIGEREVALVAKGLGRLDLQFARLRQAVIDQRPRFQVLREVAHWVPRRDADRLLRRRGRGVNSPKTTGSLSEKRSRGKAGGPHPEPVEGSRATAEGESLDPSTSSG